MANRDLVEWEAATQGNYKPVHRIAVDGL